MFTVNLPALEAVLDDMPGVNALIYLGDIVGYNPFRSECVDLVRERCYLVLQENYDMEVRNPERYKENMGAYAGLKLACKEFDSQGY